MGSLHCALPRDKARGEILVPSAPLPHDLDFHFEVCDRHVGPVSIASWGRFADREVMFVPLGLVNLMLAYLGMAHTL